MLHSSPLLKKTCVIQVVLDKWFPLIVIAIWLRAITATLATASPAARCRSICHLLLDDQAIQDVIGEADKLHKLPTDGALAEPLEFVLAPWGEDHVGETDVHKVVHSSQRATVGVSILQLHEHGPTSRAPQHRLGKHHGASQAARQADGRAPGQRAGWPCAEPPSRQAMQLDRRKTKLCTIRSSCRPTIYSQKSKDDSDIVLPPRI